MQKFELIRNVTNKVAPMYKTGAKINLTNLDRKVFVVLGRIFRNYLTIKDRLKKVDVIMLFGSSSLKVPAHAADQIYKFTG